MTYRFSLVNLPTPNNAVHKEIGKKFKEKLESLEDDFFLKSDRKLYVKIISFNFKRDIDNIFNMIYIIFKDAVFKAENLKEVSQQRINEINIENFHYEVLVSDDPKKNFDSIPDKIIKIGSDIKKKNDIEEESAVEEKEELKPKLLSFSQIEKYLDEAIRIDKFNPNKFKNLEEIISRSLEAGNFDKTITELQKTRLINYVCRVQEFTEDEDNEKFFSAYLTAFKMIASDRPKDYNGFSKSGKKRTRYEEFEKCRQAIGKILGSNKNFLKNSPLYKNKIFQFRQRLALEFNENYKYEFLF